MNIKNIHKPTLKRSAIFALVVGLCAFSFSALAQYKIENGNISIEQETSGGDIVFYGGDISDGLWAHWKLDETTGGTLVDSGSGGNDLTWTDGTGNSVAEETTAGQIGTAIDFDGTNDRAQTTLNSNDSDLDYSEGISLCGWFYSDGLQTTEFPFYVWENGGSDHVIGLEIDNNSRELVAHISVMDSPNFPGNPTNANYTNYTARSTTQASGYWDGAWHHACIVYDKTLATNRLKLYADNTVVATNNVVDKYWYYHNFWQVAVMELAEDNDLGAYFDGKIDDIRVYTRALSTSDVSTLYNVSGLETARVTNAGRLKATAGIQVGDDTTETQCATAADAGTIRFSSSAGTEPSGVTFITGNLANGNLLTIATGLGFGGSDGVLAADYICQNEADTAGLSGTWMAWISGPSADNNAPADRFTQSNDPYVLTDGTQIASDWTDLIDGTLSNAINVEADGSSSTAGNNQVWTNVNTNGTTQGTNHCNDWTSASGALNGRRGLRTQTGTSWTNSGNRTCDSANRKLYCFDQALSVQKNIQYCDGSAWQTLSTQ